MISLLARALLSPRSVARSLSETLELARLRRLPRRTPARARLVRGLVLDVPDGASCAFMYNEIFRRQIYQFAPSRPDPFIIDAGANIGLSVLYFKRLLPQARVLAFEPDPQIFAYLERNVHAAALTGVELENRAVHTMNGTLSFHREGADAGRIRSLQCASGVIGVAAVRLRDILDKKVDMLKMDVEGAETDIILDCVGHLDKVERLFIEYHSFTGDRQRLPELLMALRETGFRLWMDAPVPNDRPLARRIEYLEMDMQLNVFAWREPP
jgi:FkbM family methyltransferase